MNFQAVDAYIKFSNEQNKTFKVAHNKFSDWDSEKFDEIIGYFKVDIEDENRVQKAPLNGQLPLTVDWRQKGIVPPVGKQGDCASGWAFAAADALSCAYNI